MHVLLEAIVKWVASENDFKNVVEKRPDDEDEGEYERALQARDEARARVKDLAEPLISETEAAGFNSISLKRLVKGWSTADMRDVEILVEDLERRKGHPPATIEIQDGSTKSTPQHSADFTSVNWYGQTFQFNKTQAECRILDD